MVFVNETAPSGSEESMIIVGFGSKARQGKDTAAQAIVDYYTARNTLYLRHRLGAGVIWAQRVGFADELKEVATKEYGMKEKDSLLLQRIGMERRELDPAYWIHKLEERINSKTDVLVIPDVRYWNEAEQIKYWGGYLVNVVRLGKDGKPYVDPERPANHPSEIELDTWNWDFKLVMSDGHQALLGELAITLAEYLRGLQK